MKKILLVCLVFCLAAFSAGCGNTEKEQVLNVYNWGDYIDEQVLDIFEEETGIRINYNTFATNEDMYVKIKSGAGEYDVIFPSDYMIEKMIREELIRPVDTAGMENYGQIGDTFKNLGYDPENMYSVPYMWGTLGIVYNSDVVSAEEASSWGVLWDSKYKKDILMLDSQRDTIGIALKKLGYSLNSTDERELEEAKQSLIKQKPLVLAYGIDEIKDKMMAGEASLGVMWSGDGVLAGNESENLVYSVPEEGTNIWFDAMCIPANSPNPEAAELFIDFMSRPDIALMNTEYIEYSTPNTGAFEMLDEEVQNNKAAYPDLETLGKSEVFVDPGEYIKVYDRIWTEIKAY